MTGLFYIRKKGETKPLGKENEQDWEAIDFYYSLTLHEMIWKTVSKMKSGEVLEIVCDIEE